MYFLFSGDSRHLAFVVQDAGDGPDLGRQPHTGEDGLADQIHAVDRAEGIADVGAAEAVADLEEDQLVVGGEEQLQMEGAGVKPQ